MDIVIELPKDINKICRTCMNIVNDYNNCVTSTDDNRSSDLKEMLLYLMGTIMSAEECLPKFMCDDCVRKLEVAYAFKKQCQDTYINFQNFMDHVEDPDIKNEDFSVACTNCDLYFSNQYKLSKHEINHYDDDNLYTKFNGEDSLILKDDIEEAPDDILSLILERKEHFTNVKHTVNPHRKCVSNELQETVKVTKKLICDLCDRDFNNMLALHLHFVNHAILAESDTDRDIFNQYFLCTICGETFNNDEDLGNHVLSCYSETNTYMCANCNQLFDTELHLLKHEKEYIHYKNPLWEDAEGKQNEKNSYICPICSNVFLSKSELHLHSVRHIIKQITCRICKRTFSCEIALNNHLKSHPNYKHMCDLCGRWLGSRHALKTHIMGVHSANKNFVCTICSKAFKTPSRLHIHKLIHQEEKKFMCSICSYKTNNVGDFRVHNRIHTAERPYKCNFVNCKRKFKTSSHLNEHIQRHLQIKKYQCTTCCMVFGHNHTLKMHLMVHTGEKPFSCNTCKVKFRRKHHLKNHMKQHVKIEDETHNMQD